MSICLLTVHHSPSMMILPSTWWRWKCMQEINFHTLKRLIQAQKQHSLFWTFPHSLQNAAICGTSKISFIIWNIKRSCFPYVSGMHFTKSITTFRRSQIWLAYKVLISRNDFYLLNALWSWRSPNVENCQRNSCKCVMHNLIM